MPIGEDGLILNAKLDCEGARSKAMAVRYYFGRVTLNPGQGFTGTFPDVPGFIVVGNSVEEVSQIAAQQLSSHLQTLKDEGKEVPLPQTEKHVTPFQPVSEYRILVPGDVPNETPLSLILANAQGLLREAHLLYNFGSIARAVALSIVAIEEAGKFVIYNEQRPILEKKGRLSHSEKQAVLGQKFDRLFLVEALDKEVDHYEQYLRATGKTDMLAEFLDMPRSDRMALLYSVLSEDKSLLQRTLRRVAGPEEIAIQYSRDVQRQKVSGKREQSFYVDISKDGQLAASPFAITFEEAGVWLERAEFAVYIAEQAVREAREDQLGGLS
jgi:AbiV family abortive infection protein